jgi:2,4-dienoyl-CoA reductase-like NADH-dependent reductase (Old Yellow Enzyme family)
VPALFAHIARKEARPHRRKITTVRNRAEHAERQAEKILQDGYADLIAVGRAALYNTFWANYAAQALRTDPEYRMFPDQYGWWLKSSCQSRLRA